MAGPKGHTSLWIVGCYDLTWACLICQRILCKSYVSNHIPRPIVLPIQVYLDILLCSTTSVRNLCHGLALGKMWPRNYCGKLLIFRGTWHSYPTCKRWPLRDEKNHSNFHQCPSALLSLSQEIPHATCPVNDRSLLTNNPSPEESHSSEQLTELLTIPEGLWRLWWNIVY